uniref:Uncharacterized protein n=1 Tax=Anopheles arabiensis TaxID=7173 RepID=A0A182I818_ANOAR
MESENCTCRLCLGSSKDVCSLFGSSVDRELLTIIRNNVGLEIAADDPFSKMVCDTCIAKLRTIEQHVKLFRESDRKLRDAITTRLNDNGKDSANHTLPDAGPHSNEVCNLKAPATALESSHMSNNAEVVKYKFQKENQMEPEPTRRSKRIRTQSKRLAVTTEYSTGTHDEPQSSEDFDCDNDSVDRSYIPVESSSTDCQMNQNSTTTEDMCMETVTSARQQTASSKQPKKRNLKDKAEPVPTLHDFKCYICSSEPLGSRKALIEHLATHVDYLPYTCKQCVMETIVLTRVRTLNTHMKMHEQPIKCDYCDRRYSNAAGKYYHTQTYHLAGGAPCIVHCEICGKQYGSEAALKQHMKYHTTMLKCSKCDMVFNHPNKRRNHELTHNEDRGYECVVCKKVLQTIESYDVHLKKHSQERSYPCTLCPKKFNTSFNLILHLKVHAKNYNYRPAKSWVEHYTILSRDPLQYKCNHCDRYSTDKVNNMISHLQAHFKEYECDQCKRLFATAKQLRAHYTTHTGEKSEMCQHCGKCFSTKNNLRIHLKSHKREIEDANDGTTNDRQTAVQEYPPEACIEIETVAQNNASVS